LKNLIWYCIAVLCIGCSGSSDRKDPLPPKVLPLAESASPSLSAHEIRHYRNQVQRFVDSTFKRRPFNGSILVAKNGEIVFEKYSGFRNPRVHKDSIGPNTSFHLASISKTFTAMAVLKLWEDGKLSIDDDLRKHLDSFPLEGVTIKSLLNHRSGIPNYVHYMEKLGWDRKRVVTNQDVLDFLVARHKDIDIGAPDKRFSYSNTNYALLALIIEKASALPFKDYLRVTFFEPLQMNDTYAYSPEDSARSLSSFFYSGREYAFDYLDLVYGDKNIYSTVRDLLKWDQALHPGGIFKKETLDAAYAAYSFEKPGVNNYGLGWRMFLLKNGKKFIYHNGWWHGNRTAFYRLLDDKVTIIALANNDFTKVYAAKKMADIFGNYFINPAEDAATEAINTVKTNSRVPAKDQNLAGGN
jgi:CubicO group peptidase (beta-lactamase class C family)